MTTVERLVLKPRTIAARNWIFQIHLWTGLILALYGIIIGISGSVLVFEPEYAEWRQRQFLTVEGSGPRVSVERVMDSIHAVYPGQPVGLLYYPNQEHGTYRVAVGPLGKRIAVYVNPYNGAIMGTPGKRDGWLTWLENLHFDLLSGKTGRLVNGICALLLVLMTLSGLVVWWPGKRWVRRAMSINWKARWKRMNYDIHSAVGFFTLLFVLLLSLTGAYFTWPRESRALIAWFSPIRNSAPAPKLPKRLAQPEVQLSALAQVAQRAVPDAWLELILFPSRPTEPLEIFLMTGGPRDFQTASTVYLDPSTAEVLRVDRAKGRSAGDALVTWIPSLHFGNFGGVMIKIVWVLLGLTPALLAVTGALMWWNRVASKKIGRKPPTASRSRDRLTSVVGS